MAILGLETTTALALSVPFVLLYWSSHTFRYYLKFSLYYVVIFFDCTIAIPICALRPGRIENTNYLSWLLGWTSWIFGIKFDIVNKERLTSEEQRIVVANHQSSLDVMGMMLVWPYLTRCVPLMKKELKWSGSFGIISILCGAIFVNRFDKNKAQNAVTDAVVYIREKKTNVWIFPEGTRSCTKTFLPFKKGAFRIAIAAQVPVQPIVFSSYMPFYNPKTKHLGTGNVKCVVLEPISTKGLTEDDIDTLSDEVRNKMLKVFYEISDIEPPQTNGRLTEPIVTPPRLSFGAETDGDEAYSSASKSEDSVVESPDDVERVSLRKERIMDTY